MLRKDYKIEHTNRPIFPFACYYFLFALIIYNFEMKISILPLVVVMLSTLVFSKITRLVKNDIYIYIIFAFIIAQINLYIADNIMYKNVIFFEDKMTVVVGKVVDLPRINEKGTFIYKIKTESLEAKGKKFGGKTNIILYSTEDLKLEALDRVCLKALLFTPYDSFYEGGYSGKNVSKSKGIFLNGFVSKSSFMELEPSGDHFLRFALNLKKEILNRLSTLENPYSELLKGMILGERHEINPKITQDFKRSGLSHLLAVSGLHLSIFAGVVYTFCASILYRRKLAHILVIVVSIIYLAICCFSPSITRSAIMHILMSGAALLRKDYDPKAALSVSVLAIVLLSPFGVLDISLQLSTISTLGILLISEPITALLQRKFSGRKFNKLKQYLFSVIGVSSGATIFSSPLILYYFGGISTLSIFANILVEWAVAPLLLMGAIYCTGAWFVSPVITFLANYILYISGWISDLPFAFVVASKVKSFALLSLIAAVVGILLNYQTRKITKRLCILGIVFALLILSYTTQNQIMGEGELHFVDVGQGDCTIIESENSAVMIDCGTTSGNISAGERALEYMDYSKIKHIDLLVLTHYHTDHTSGVLELIQSGRVKKVLIPQPGEGEEKDKITQMLQSFGVDYEEVRDDTTFALYGINGTIFTRQIAGEGEDANEKNLVVNTVVAGRSVLITGDLTKNGEQAFMHEYTVDCDILKIAHHGSKNSTTGSFIDAISPQYGIISCEKDNSYNHPSFATLATLFNKGVKTVRTDLEGTITIGIKDNEMVIRK